MKLKKNTKHGKKQKKSNTGVHLRCAWPDWLDKMNGSSSGAYPSPDITKGKGLETGDIELFWRLKDGISYISGFGVFKKREVLSAQQALNRGIEFGYDTKSLPHSLKPNQINFLIYSHIEIFSSPIAIKEHFKRSQNGKYHVKIDFSQFAQQINTPAFPTGDYYALGTTRMEQKKLREQILGVSEHHNCFACRRLHHRNALQVAHLGLPRHKRSGEQRLDLKSIVPLCGTCHLYEEAEFLIFKEGKLAPTTKGLRSVGFVNYVKSW